MPTPAERAQRSIYLAAVVGVALVAGLAVVHRASSRLPGNAATGPVEAPSRTVIAGLAVGPRSIALRSLYQGEIRTVLIHAGRGRIAAGTPLFVLSRRTARIEFIERQRRLAMAIHGRIEECAAAGILSRQVAGLYEQYFEGRAAAADIRLPRLRHDVADDQCHGAIAGELWARTTLGAARDALAGTVVHAPFDLFVLGVNVEPGTVVTPTTELARVVDANDLIVMASGVAVDHEQAAVGTTVLMRRADGRLLDGRIARVEVGADEGYPDDVLIEIEPGPAARLVLAVGETLDVILDGNRSERR